MGEHESAVAAEIAATSDEAARKKLELKQRRIATLKPHRWGKG